MRENLEIIDRMQENMPYLLGANAVFSLFTALSVNVLIKDYDFSLNPIYNFRFALYYGFPFGLFFLTFITVLCFAAYAVHSNLVEERKRDPLGRNITYSQKNKNFGESHLLQPREYEENAIVQTVENAYGNILGKYEAPSGEQYCINWRLDHNRINPHILVVGASGVGKSVSVTENMIMQSIKNGWSITVTDPKAEEYRKYKVLLESHGYYVRCFNMVDPIKSDGWDVMKSIRQNERYDEDIEAMANAIVDNMEDSSGSQGAAFRAGARMLLQAVKKRVHLGKDFSENFSEENLFVSRLSNDDLKIALKNHKFLCCGKKDMRSVMALLQKKDNEFLETFFSEEYLRMVGAEDAAKSWDSYKKASVNFQGNIAVTLLNGMGTLNTGSIMKVLTTNDIDLELPGHKLCAYFIVFPLNTPSFQFITSLFFTTLTMKLMKLAEHSPGNRLPIPMQYILDEFTQMGVINDWGGKMAMIRSTGISVCMIIQDFVLLRGRYGDAASSIRGNCGTLLNLGVNEETTRKAISEECGMITVENETIQYTESRNFLFQNVRRGHSISYSGRPLFYPDELRTMDINKVLIIIQGKYPIYASKFHCSEHPLYKELPREHPDDQETIMYDINDIPDIGTKERDEYNRRLMEQYEEYWKTHDMPSKEDRKYKGKCVPYYEAPIVNSIRTAIEIQIDKLRDVYDNIVAVEQEESATESDQHQESEDAIVVDLDEIVEESSAQDEENNTIEVVKTYFVKLPTQSPQDSEPDNDLQDHSEPAPTNSEDHGTVSNEDLPKEQNDESPSQKDAEEEQGTGSHSEKNDPQEPADEPTIESNTQKHQKDDSDSEKNNQTVQSKESDDNQQTLTDSNESKKDHQPKSSKPNQNNAKKPSFPTIQQDVNPIEGKGKGKSGPVALNAVGKRNKRR